MPEAQPIEPAAPARPPTRQGFGTGAGRRKGAQNKKSMEFRARVDRLCEARGFDLVQAVVEQAMGIDPILFDGLTPAERAPLISQGRRTLLDYAYPRLKAVEHSVAQPVRVVIRDDESDQKLLE